ncbi:bifunctional proline dehydrogenase/L-glutamate gamma-semialdehyde dehydrogenase PutA [Woodsholea maritima]|uniref:bifunctional proline dehydrogenase/L-glutamate gamma-semialdehyde dehydrogenase PutA n=1 Tax=Woodsholea maritima TaxID=240237 RepID=UPI0003813B67|nr:bifunctional proline dehydrogenase/L-glutamate gamma-semialdehyde dehydrogenase PutA [Woodsholea maritima]
MRNIVLPNIDWDGLDKLKFSDETSVARLLDSQVGLKSSDRTMVEQSAIDLVERARSSNPNPGLMESFLQEFGLSNKEGLALMCLAEALLRVPDSETTDQLIAEKIGSGAWAEHAWKSDNWLVNVSTMGLMLTGSLMDVDDKAKENPTLYFKRLVARLGEPVVRAAVRQAMKIMGEQFVLGQSIDAAFKRGRQWDKPKQKALFSFDMLGEAARNEEDAERYHQAYLKAIARVSAKRGDGPIELVDGISIKLSALHGSYYAVKEEKVFNVLYPRLLEQAQAAKAGNIGFCLDAEEADRLVISLKLLDRLAREPSLAGWGGLGLAVQAYQKRSRAVIEKLIELAQQTQRRFLVRLVKGAYWDTEIKRSQQDGDEDFPVWTTKASTDMNYLATARLMLAAREEIYPQFATHNAHSLCAVRAIAEELGNQEYEFQRLHGMGDALYDAAYEAFDIRPVRIYAPVGEHKDLLPYLVRRLLENGANTSFVHSFLDPSVPAEDVAKGPFDIAKDLDRHPSIALPRDLYGEGRVNSKGADLTQAEVRERMAAAQAQFDAKAPYKAGPIINGESRLGETQAFHSPADRNFHVADVTLATRHDVDEAFKIAHIAHKSWDAKGGVERAKILRHLGDVLEADMDRFIALMARETGKTLEDGVAEVREAVDFLRYYSAQAEEHFGDPVRLPGPAGETNHLRLKGRGVFVCISPWNFPLAIFIGQWAAALAAGNTVIAKPAEQSPLTGYEAVKLFLANGLPEGTLQYLPGTGEEVGAVLTRDERTDGVCFTGSTHVAQIINRTLADRKGPIAPLIAETGGLNGMFVDTSALKEQVVDDAILSAFGSAGQRCSACRVLFLPTDIADDFIEGLMGAMDELVVGDPTQPSTSLGPVIDEEAHKILCEHVERMRTEAKVLKEYPLSDELKAKGYFFPPTLIELPSIDVLDEEKFGPILHVVRYERSKLKETAEALAAKRYGLTLGVHSRIERFMETIREAVPAGNVYVNRNMTGAVVGVQPFGGEGLSGTGPKAGGPHYLFRFAAEQVVTINISAQGGDPELLNLT